MKRSNRLVLLIGVFLAIVAFVGILLLAQGDGGGGGTPEVPTELPTVVATADIPLGTKITADQVTTQVLPIDAREAGSYEDTSQVIGKVVRAPVSTGQQITGATFGSTGQVLDIVCPVGLVCMAVEVDQVTGVGTVIKTGDYVDMVVVFTGEKSPVVTLDPQTDSANVVAGVPSKFPNQPFFLRPVARGLLFNRVLRTGSFPKAKTNRAMDPERGPGTPAEARVRLEAALGRFDHECRACAEQGGVVKSPTFGAIAVADYARFMAIHTQHHRRQLPGIASSTAA